MKIDMHVHSDLSYDSTNTLSDIEGFAIERGLDGVALCNHNIFKVLFSDKIIIIPAAEYSTDKGHILTYFLKEPIEEKIKKRENGLFCAHEVIREAHLQGAVCFLAHPFAPKKERSDDFFREIDGIEVINAKAHCSSKKSCNKEAQRLCKKLEKPFCAGSDSHFPHEIGSAYTVFNAASGDEIKSCLIKKNTVAQLCFQNPVKSAFLRLCFNIKKQKSVIPSVLKVFYSFFVKAQLVFGIRDKNQSFE